MVLMQRVDGRALVCMSCFSPRTPVSGTTYVRCGAGAVNQLPGVGDAEGWEGVCAIRQVAYQDIQCGRAKAAERHLVFQDGLKRAAPRCSCTECPGACCVRASGIWVACQPESLPRDGCAHLSHAMQCWVHHICRCKVAYQHYQRCTSTQHRARFTDSPVFRLQESST